MNQFSPQSRIWLYLSDKEFSESESAELNQHLQQFCIQWTAHGENLKAHGEVLHNRFVLLIVDESVAGASGCSIDKSVHFIQQVEKKIGVHLFDRLIFAWKKQTGIRVSHFNDLQKLYDQGEITVDTIVFDTLVSSKKEFDEQFEIPLRKSWMMKRIKLSQELIS